MQKIQHYLFCVIFWCCYKNKKNVESGNGIAEEK